MSRESWKNKALKRQLSFKKKLRRITSGKWGGEEYKNILSDTDAIIGYNFYCYSNLEEWKELQYWAKRPNCNKVNFLGAGMKNMLRSEHIPYNLFYPLAKMMGKQDELLNQFLEQLLDNKIHVDKVTDIKIEFASELQKEDLLDDNTSFDAYIEYKDGEDTCGLGIEVKYTERSYPYGDTEEARMNDESSIYNQLSKRSGIYKTEKLKELRTKKLKQPWRNLLLGLRLIERNQIQKFHSVHMYPKGNTYQKIHVCDEYIKCLSYEVKNTFVPITFEKFIETGEKVFTDSEHLEWINYLKERY